MKMKQRKAFISKIKNKNEHFSSSIIFKFHRLTCPFHTFLKQDICDNGSWRGFQNTAVPCLNNNILK